MREVPATWFVAIEALFVLGVVVGTGVGVMTVWPSEDAATTALRVGGAWLALLVYGVAGWYATASHDVADRYGWKVGPLRMDNPLSYRDDWERTRYSFWFWLLPGKLLAGAVLDLFAWASSDEG